MALFKKLASVEGYQQLKVFIKSNGKLAKGDVLKEMNGQEFMLALECLCEKDADITDQFKVLLCVEVAEHFKSDKQGVEVVGNHTRTFLNKWKHLFIDQFDDVTPSVLQSFFASGLMHSYYDTLNLKCKFESTEVKENGFKLQPVGKKS